MDRDGVIDSDIHRIGLVIADDDPAILGDQLEQEIGEATLLLAIQQADMPGPGHALEDRREAVDIDENRGLARVQTIADTGLIRAVDFPDAGVDFAAR